MDEVVKKVPSTLEIEQIGAYLGAEVHGVDFSKPIDNETFEFLYASLCEHEVLVFRDANITTEGQMAFGRLFGELSVHPFSPNDEDRPELILFQNDETNAPFGTDVWHSDETFREDPPLATCLRALDVPKVGGDTMFASMTAAYEGLSDRMKHFITGLEAIHDLGPFKRLFPNTPEGQKQLRHFQARYPDATHPVVREHPVTGKLSIFVNPQFTIRIKGMTENESQPLLQQLFDLAKVPEYQYRHHWYNDTMIIWDNRSVQHYAVHDYWPQKRYMERVTVAGDKTFGPVDADAEDSVKSRKNPMPAGNGDNFGGHAPKRPHERDGAKTVD
jgi:taurine dioxygenase